MEINPVLDTHHVLLMMVLTTLQFLTFHDVKVIHIHVSSSEFDLLLDQ